MTTLCTLLRRGLASATLAALLAPTAFAQATIDQNKVLAGNVTPGDTPGFPLTLSQPGSYRLTSNLAVPSGTVGIEITAQGVTLDLNGFGVRSTNTCSQNTASGQVTCTEASSSNAHGILVTASAMDGAAIRSGYIEGFRGDGINARMARLSDLTVRHNVRDGILLLGTFGPQGGAQLSGVEVAFNGGHGIHAIHTLVHRALSRQNGQSGMQLDGESVVHDSIVRTNGGCGVFGGAVRGVLARKNYQNNCDFKAVESLGGNLGAVAF